ncbi:S24/S26 family peptidase [Alistipes sp.]|uniref:S24/S26 family peptidase n=1 Tax=Alistipes sp. TaxID=1872444 RepID=UPI003AF1145A
MKRIANGAAFALARDLLREGHPVSVRVEGQSMLPFFRSGSVIRLRPLAAGDLARGKVVLGETDAGTFVVHRILHIGRERITLLGDGNWCGTESIARERVHGIVDCGRLHLALARIWLWLRPVRKYPLWLLRRICPR